MESGAQSSGNYRPSQQTQQGVDAVRGNPHLPQPRAPRLTQEELNVLEECNTESFWYRCLPLAAAFGGTTTFLVKTGHLKPHPRYGPTLKTLAAVFVGYVAGKISYQSTCQQKILEKIPQSNLAQSIRKNRGMATFSEGEMSPGVGTSPDAMEMEKMRDSYSSIDLSSDSRSSAAMKELDDNLRPSLDREVKHQDETAADPQRTLTYDELRQRNRQEYDRSMLVSSNSPLRQRPFPVPSPKSGQPPADSFPAQPPPQRPAAVWDVPPPEAPGKRFEQSTGQRKNQYGDVWDN